MAARQVAKNQPKDFKFTAENLEKAKKIIAKYPHGRQQSAVIPLLYIAQNQNKNWLPIPAMEAVGELLSMPYIRVYEVATFYTMFNLAPVGEHFIQLCRTTPCWLRGADAIKDTCMKKLGLEHMGETTSDGKFTVVEVECLGACVNAPMVQINDDYFEDLTPQIMEEIIDDLSAGKKIKKGTQVDRINSAPASGLTTLKKAKGGK